MKMPHGTLHNKAHISSNAHATTLFRTSTSHNPLPYMWKCSQNVSRILAKYDQACKYGLKY